MEQEPETVEQTVAVVWPALDGLPMQFVNVFAIQLGPPAGQSGIPDGIHMLVGNMALPLITGDTPAEVAASAARFTSIPVSPLARYVFSREHAEGLRDYLNTVLGQYERVTRGAHPNGPA